MTGSAAAAPPIPPPNPASRDLGAFEGVDAWIFDLDNTLYPRSSNLFDQVDVRIRLFVEKLLGVEADEAQRIQKSFYRDHGTTLRGLMLNHAVEADDFLAFVHDIDHTVVEPDPALCAAVLRLPGRKLIFTNGSRRHAEKVAARLGFTDHFEDIFDIVSAELLPKPERATYDRFVAQFGLQPKRAAMFEDLARNLVVPKALGMATILVVPSGIRTAVEETWEFEGRDDDHVDFVIDDLGGFIGRIADAIGA